MATTCGTITVREAFSKGRVTADSCSGLPSEVGVGEEVTLNVTVSNGNDTSAQGTVFIEAGRTELGRKDFVTAGGGETDLEVAITFPSSGDYTVEASVSGVSEGTGSLSFGQEDYDAGRKRTMTRY